MNPEHKCKKNNCMETCTIKPNSSEYYLHCYKHREAQTKYTQKHRYKPRSIPLNLSDETKDDPRIIEFQENQKRKRIKQMEEKNRFFSNFFAKMKHPFFSSLFDTEEDYYLMKSLPSEVGLWIYLECVAEVFAKFAFFDADFKYSLYNTNQSVMDGYNALLGDPIVIFQWENNNEEICFKQHIKDVIVFLLSQNKSYTKLCQTLKNFFNGMIPYDPHQMIFFHKICSEKVNFIVSDIKTRAFKDYDFKHKSQFVAGQVLRRYCALIIKRFYFKSVFNQTV